MIMILQGSVVTQAVLGGLTIYHPVTNFLQFTCVRHYENWLRVLKVIAIKTMCSFFGPHGTLLTLQYFKLKID